MNLLLRYTFFLFLIYLGTVSCKVAQSSSTVSQNDTAVFNLAYADQSGRQKLDIYLPARAKGTRLPVIVGIHGGAFWAGDKQSESFVYKNGLKRGYAVVCINYRLSQEARFPAQIYDVKAAIRWLRAHADHYGLDPNRIAVWGTSAGGYLSALAGTSGGVVALEDKSMGNADQSSHVQAVIDWYGPTNFLLMDAQDRETGIKPIMDMAHNDPRSPESMLMGAPIQDIPEKVHLANPETYISDDDPPFYIQHGLADDHVSWKQSATLARKLQKVIGEDKVYVHFWEGAGHGTDQFFTPENYAGSLDFLDKLFK